MVKPESQVRLSNYRSHSSERRLTPDAEAHTNGTLSSLNPAVVEHQPIPKTPSLEDIEDAFLNCYSNFLGSDINEKTTWKSENFSQSQERSMQDRKTSSDSSKIAKTHPLRQLKPSLVNPEEFH